MKHGFVRVGCYSPEVTVADCKKNAEAIIEAVKCASEKEISLLVLPELCITGYTCSDLFLQKPLLNSAVAALIDIAQKTAPYNVLFAVGLPMVYNSSVFNCAAWIHRGKILAFIPKTHIPNYSEFYEARHFTSARVLEGRCDLRIDLAPSYTDIPFGTDIVIQDRVRRSFTLATEICEDLWVNNNPSVYHAQAGAAVIVNLSASNEVVGKKEYRSLLVQAQSGRLACAYLYADAGPGESTTDLIFASHNLIAENGKLLAESERFGNGFIFTEIDLDRIWTERRRQTTFTPSNIEYTKIFVDLLVEKPSFTLTRAVSKTPFVPSEDSERENRCEEIIQMQSHSLAKRLKHTGCKTAVIGLSGGLDSTLAFLAAYDAFSILGLNHDGLYAVTMPCFGTTDRTYNNAVKLAHSLKTGFKEINIEKSVLQHFNDIGHDVSKHDVVFENSQARERTQVLMDIANQVNGLVIGTGDLSELALGWATYNGDHMSMYGVNSSIPKTLVRYLVKHKALEFAKLHTPEADTISNTLTDILNTPVSPELLPPVDGNIAQKTEEIVGPYELHDFFLYYVIRWGYTPGKILYLAEQAFKPDVKDAEYSRKEIISWLKNFYKRFFSQQFKRSCLPDGAKVGTVSLSPRGDWRMPSDASASLWLSELEKLT